MTYPILLIHGVCRFDWLWKEPLNLDNTEDPELDLLHYFKGVRTMLQRHGFVVYHASVSWGANVTRRAADLRQQILKVLEATGAAKVNLIAHSMGGLDARHLLFNDRHQGRIHERVASLTTIATPHAGTPFADWGLRHLPHLIPVAQKLGLDITALADLRLEPCRRFTEDPEVQEFEARLEEKILFQTYAGRQQYWAVFEALKLPFYIIEKEEGDNDGLVSVQSALWRPRYFKGILEQTDHLNELGWWEPAQLFAGESPEQLLQRIHRFYLEVARALP